MDWDKIRVFRAVAIAGSLTHAGDSLKLSQSAVSRQINALEKDLNSIFKWIEQLNQLNTDKVEPLTSIAETTLRFRKDQIESKNIREDILKNSPKDNKDYFVVPKVVE